MRIIQVIILLASVFFTSCAGRPVNQYKNGKKDGKWIYQNKKTDGYSRGKYQLGTETGTWKYYEGKKLARRERYKNNMADVKFYYPNGKISSRGQTRFDTTATELHWYYTGDWKYYNQRGKLTEIRTFVKGKPVREKVYRFEH